MTRNRDRRVASEKPQKPQPTRQAPELTDLEEDIERAERALLAEFDADAQAADYVMRVYCVPPKGLEEYLFTASVADFPIVDKLRDEYGSGYYRVRIRLGNEIKRILHYKIRARTGLPPIAQPRETQQPAPASSSESSSIAVALEQQGQLLRTLVERMTQAPAVRQVEPAVQFNARLDTMVKLRALEPKAAAGGDKAMDYFLQGIQFGERTGGAGGDGGPLTVLIQEFMRSGALPEIMRTAEAQKNARQNPPRVVRPRPPAPAIAPASSSAPPPPVDQAAPIAPANAQQAQLLKLREQVDYLCTRAAIDADTELYADWTIDNIPPEIVEGFLADPNAIALLEQLVPDVARHRAWFQRLIAQLKLIPLVEEPPGDVEDDAAERPGPRIFRHGTADAPDSNPERDRGHSGNSQDHVAPGPALPS